jgi:hypothetical protein
VVFHGGDLALVEGGEAFEPVDVLGVLVEVPFELVGLGGQL